MKANIRHVQGSTRSRRTTLPRSAISARRFSIAAKSTYKMRTKCIQKCTCKFVNCSPTETYNFEALKRMHFAAAEQFPLPGGEGQGEGQTGSPWCSDPRQPIPSALSVFAPLLLTRASPTPQPELTILDKMRLLRLRLPRMGNFETIPILARFQPRCTNDLRRHRHRASHFAQTSDERTASPPRSTLDSRPSTLDPRLSTLDSRGHGCSPKPNKTE
jgi:hypothetical protein